MIMIMIITMVMMRVINSYDDERKKIKQLSGLSDDDDDDEDYNNEGDHYYDYEDEDNDTFSLIILLLLVIVIIIIIIIMFTFITASHADTHSTFTNVRLT